MNDLESRKLDAIVGAAIKALAESGAADDFVGSFAASHRAKVANILGQQEKTEPAPDLLTLVTKAVEIAIGNAGLSSISAQRKEARAKRFYVTVGGKKTSLTISRPAIAKLVQVVGDERQAKAVIQDLADNAPSDVDNRSKWVEQRMLSLADSSAAQETQRH